MPTIYMFDVVITTYNRPKKVKELIIQLLGLNTNFINKIIIVDSSELEDYHHKSNEQIIYLSSSHKNQPYQRFLGFSVSKADFILFLDDDMEIIDLDVFKHLNSLLIQTNAEALALNFKNKFSNTSLSQIPKSNLFSNFSSLKTFKNWITGLPDLKEGKLGLCGNRGKHPKNIKEIEFIQGGAFVVKRESVYQNFNFQLFDLYENKLGKGEDAIIGYTLHVIGKVFFVPTPYFVHNDQNDSTYSTDIENYAKRVAFSRLYLSLEKTRLDNSSFLLAKLHYNYYMFFRLFGIFVNYLIKPSLSRKKVLQGTIKGWIQAMKFSFDNKHTYKEKWINEVKKDLN